MRVTEEGLSYWPCPELPTAGSSGPSTMQALVGPHVPILTTPVYPAPVPEPPAVGKEGHPEAAGTVTKPKRLRTVAAVVVVCVCVVATVLLLYLLLVFLCLHETGTT